jgi:hypothetical protein
MMTQETLRRVAPSVFATTQSAKMSNKYSFVPTYEVVEKFQKEGWEVASAKQLGKGQFAVHELRLRNGALPNVGDSLVEALVRNSHNGLSSFSVSMGLFRLVCSNGLTVPTSLSDTISLRHMSIDIGDVRQITDEFANRLPIIERSVNRMENTILDDETTMDFLNRATHVRWEKIPVPQTLNLSEFLVRDRPEDEGKSVWTTFNVIQEKFVRGGQKYTTPKGRNMTMKQLKNFNHINKINTGLWELAETYCD